MSLPVALRTRPRGVVDGAGAAPQQQCCELTAEMGMPPPFWRGPLCYPLMYSNKRVSLQLNGLPSPVGKHVTHRPSVQLASHKSPDMPQHAATLASRPTLPAKLSLTRR